LLRHNPSSILVSRQTFTTPADPANANLATLQNQLNDYLAFEAGTRSQPNSSALLAKLKGPKFFLQFQIARVKTAQGQKLDVADTVDHQLGKVTKASKSCCVRCGSSVRNTNRWQTQNAVGATSAEIAQVSALAKQL
jgi:hypothetical protein